MSESRFSKRLLGHAQSLRRVTVVVAAVAFCLPLDLTRQCVCHGDDASNQVASERIASACSHCPCQSTGDSTNTLRTCCDDDCRHGDCPKCLDEPTPVAVVPTAEILPETSVFVVARRSLEPSTWSDQAMIRRLMPPPRSGRSICVSLDRWLI